MTAQPRTTLVVLQPGYLPWLGFFDQMARATVFVYYDDVQFDKHGWRNRNRVKGPDGQAHWLTVPVRHHGKGTPRICDIEIDGRQPWARKHLGTLRQFYGRTAYCERYLLELEECLNRPWERLLDLDVAVVALMCRWLELSPRIEFASRLEIPGERSERLLNLCLHFQAECYLSGDAAQAYLDTALFAQHGIGIEWQRFAHPAYPQQHGAFVPYLSAVDLVLNCGEASAAILAGARRQALAG